MTDARREARFEIRQRYVELMDGDFRAAAVLDLMLGFFYWIDGQSGRHWIHKSVRGLADDLMGVAGRSKCADILSDLTAAGYLEREDGDRPDAATKWRVNVDLLEHDLRDIGWSLPGYGGGVRRDHDADTPVRSMDTPVHDADRSKVTNNPNNNSSSSAREEPPELKYPDDPAMKSSHQPKAVRKWREEYDLPELPDKRRWDFQMFVTHYNRETGQRLRPGDTRQGATIRAILRHFPKGKIVECIGLAAEPGINRPWQYFTACLERMAEERNGGGSSKSEPKWKKRMNSLKGGSQ